MANLQGAFEKLHRRIALTPDNMVALRITREAIRDRIRKYFRETLNQQIPRFRGQGAYAINTLVNPIDGEYDLDDGVYLQHLDNRDARKWPSGATVRQWLINAVEGRGREEVVEKKACVRVRYPGLYHVDLPVYGILNGRCMLAPEGENQWRHSDPLALIQWIKTNVDLYGEQLLRIIRFLKAWADFQSLQLGKTPSGLMMTVLATRHFQDHARDDIAVTYTLQVISKAVTCFFYVPNPVDISEELTDGLTQNQKERFRDAIKSAAMDARGAIRVKSPRSARKLWRRQFGCRFPLEQKKDKHMCR
ncbi:MAG: hypothetical protein PVH87_23710 [Desulfobacteraceae bacterium]|jgi:hypothetical protein